MGIFDFLKNELLEIIEWREQDQNVVVWKFPDKNCDIKYGAQLTVRDSQSALFLNEGQIADVYYPGRYQLVTENMPVLTTLKSWKYGFESPFKADVYFISTRQFTNLKWGTPAPIILRDPQFKQVRVKAFGVYFIRIKDPKVFFKEFAGTAPIMYAEQLEDALRDIVSPKFAEALAEAQISVLDMVSNYTEIGEKIKPLLVNDFDLLGLELVKFQVSSTSLPPEVEEFYDKMTNMNMVDNMDEYSKFQQLNALEKAAENGGNSGLIMTNMVMSNMNNNPLNTPPKQESREDILKTIKELGELKQAGILTEEEFNTKKKELLAKL